MMQAAVMEVGWLEPEDIQVFFMPFLSRRCRQKQERIRPVAGRTRSLGAELLLQVMLGRLGILGGRELAEEPGGKPYFPEHPEVQFNVSHSGSYVACVVSCRESGVDIQEIRPEKANVAGRYFSRWEQEYIRQSENPEKAFIEIWALRESYLKKTGEGLALSLRDFSLEPADVPAQSGLVQEENGKTQVLFRRGFQARRSGQIQPERFWLWEGAPGYMMAVCGQEDLAPEIWRVGQQEVKEFFGWIGPD